MYNARETGRRQYKEKETDEFVLCEEEIKNKEIQTETERQTNRDRETDK